MDKKKLLKTGLAGALCLTIGGVVIACSPDGGNGGGGGDEPPTHEITATITNTTIEIGQNETISLDVETMEGEEFSYVIDRPGIITYNAETGNILGVNVGTVNITFTVIGTPSISKTVTINVVNSTASYEVVIGDNEPMQVAYGAKLEKPADPTKASTNDTVYTFDCWIKEGTDIEWDFDTPVTGPLVLVPKFTESVRKYNVILNGSVLSLEYNSKLTQPSNPIINTKPGYSYSFDGWYIKGTDTVWDFDADRVVCDVEIEARFTETIKKYDVIVNGVEKEVEHGTLLEKPADPTKETTESTIYTFDNWYIKGTDTVWNFESDKVVGDVEIEARFNEAAREYDVVVNGVAQKVAYGVKLEKPANPTKETTESTIYTFDNWYIKGTDTVWNFLVDKVSKDVEIEARFTETARKYRVTISGVTREVAYGVKLEKPADPTKESTIENVYVFDGWYIKGTDTKWDFDTDTVSGEVVIEPRFDEQVRKYDITIDGQLQKVEYGALIEKPADPTKETTESTIYTFDNWYIKGTDTVWNFESDKVVGDVEIEARFNEATREYAITFVMEDKEIAIGGKTYLAYEFSEDETASMSAKIVDKDGNEVALDSNEATLAYGDYNVVIDFNGAQIVKAFSADSAKEVVVERTKTNLGGTSDGRKSFSNPNKVYVNADAVSLSHYDFTYQDETFGDRYYIESDIYWDGAKSANYAGLVGIMAASRNEVLEASGGGKLIIGVTKAGKLSYTYQGGWGHTPIEIADVKDKIAYDGEAFSYKLGVYRNGADYAIFVNGDYISTITLGMFGKCSFGVGSINNNDDNGKTHFTNYVYSFNEQLLADLQEMVAKDEIVLNVTTDSDYMIDSEGNKQYYHNYTFTNAMAQNLSVEIYDAENNLVKTVVSGENNFTLSLKEGTYTFKASYKGTKGKITTKETTVTINSDTKDVAYDISLMDLGGSYTLPNGTVVNSFNTSYTITSNNSWTANGPAYAYAGGVTGSMYYIESTISKSYKGWYGFIMNSSEGAPTNGFRKVAMGVLNSGSLYVQHSVAHDWNSGKGKGSVSAHMGSGDTYKIAALRVNNRYTFYVNGVEVWSEIIDSYDINGNLLSADNISGVGLFRGGNHNADADGTGPATDVVVATNPYVIQRLINGDPSYDEIVVNVTTDSDYVMSNDGEKIYLQEELTDNQIKNIELEIYYENGTLVRTMYAPGRNFEITLKPGNYKFKAIYHGVCGNTVKETNVTIDEENTDVAYDISITDLGGSFVDATGEVAKSVVKSTTEVTHDSADSITATRDHLSFVNGETGNIYYIEGTVQYLTNNQPWIGFVVNSTAPNADGNASQISFGVTYGSLYLLRHQKGTDKKDPIENWTHGYSLGSATAAIGGKDYKLGVLRVNDTYKVYINGTLLHTGTYAMVDKNYNTLPANNISGFGVYRGSQGVGTSIGMSNVKYTTNPDAIKAIIGEEVHAYNVEFSSVAKDITFGGKNYATVDLDDADIEYSLYGEDGKQLSLDGSVVELINGNYTVKATYNNATFSKSFTVDGKDLNVEVEISSTNLNGSVGGFNSFVHASKEVKSADEVWLGYYDFTYQNDVQGTRYYIETDSYFEAFSGKTNANIVGIMAAVQNADLNGSGGNKLIIGVNQAGVLGYSYEGSWSNNYFHAITDVKSKIAYDGDKYGYKLGVYRNESDFYIFINNEYITSISLGMFENCGFGLGSMAQNTSNGYTKFTNFMYSMDESLLSAIDEVVQKDAISVEATTDTDYIMGANGSKIYYQDMDAKFQRAISLEILDSEKNVVKTVVTVNRNFTIALKPGTYTVKATFAGVKANTVKETKITISKENASFAYDISVTDLGGSFVDVNGKTVTSGGKDTGATYGSADSVTLSNDYLAFINDVTGNVYYIEGNVTYKSNTPWLGFVMNTSAPDANYNYPQISFGDTYNQMYLLRHQSGSDQKDPITNWTHGYSLGSTSAVIGAKDYKLGILRNKNEYKVYINGTLVHTGIYTAVDNTYKSLAGDNISGLGVYRGHQGVGTAVTMSNVKYTLNENAINAIFGGIEATLECDSNVTVLSGNKTVENGGSIIGLDGTTKYIAIATPAGKNIKSVAVTLNGNPVAVQVASGGMYAFDLVESGKIAISVEYEDANPTTLTLSYESAYVMNNGEKLALYDISSVNPSDITVEVISLSGSGVSTFTFDEASKTIDLSTGKYKVNFIYNNNLWSKEVFIDEAGMEIVGQISNVYLGGAITYTANTGSQVTLKSFNNADVNATAGGGWKLVDGYRNNINTFSHSFAFQNNVVGNKYYVEGVFDSTKTNYSSYDANFSGLLFAHVNHTALDASGHSKSVAYIKKDSVVIGTTEAWSLSTPIHIANYKDVLGEGNYDPTAVKLGILRDGTDYYFYVNDVFVAYRKIDTYGDNVSGFGTASSVVDNVISNFNYTTNEEVLDKMTSSVQVQGRSIDIYLIAGQSNAAGYTSYTDANMLQLDDNYVYGFQNIMYAGNAESSSGTTTVPHEQPWSIVRVGQGAGTSKIGPEVGMAKALSSYYNYQSGNEMGIIKFAHGGTCLLDVITGENACSGNWVSPSYEATITPKSKGNLTGGLYRKLLLQVEKNVNELKAMGYENINIKGLYWMQGESDKGNPSEYLKAFKYFASDIRSDLTKLLGQDCSAMPILIGEISRTSGSAVTATVNTNNAFIAMQNTIPANVSNTYVIAAGQYDINKLVSGINTAVGTDSWHWNYNDHVEIGKLVGESILENILKVNN